MKKQTPLLEAVAEYLERDAARFHMPGHKGIHDDLFGDMMRYDITEVAGADSLYEASGAIRKTEELFAGIYGTMRTLLSAGGATLCIQTMLALTAKPGGKVITGRNIHISAVNAMALLGLTPLWLYPSEDVIYSAGGRASPQDIEALLAANNDGSVCAVYITSPDYFGALSDIRAISEVCRLHRVPLLVDNAHGSHLKFMKKSLHPIDLGADMCCDSLHKTMPVLTGGALLHINDEHFVSDAKRRMTLFGSTSPSYLILLSCDHCINICADSEFPAKLELVCERVRGLEELAAQKGFIPMTGMRDYTKLVLSVHNWGISGADFGARLRAAGIEPEYVSDMHAVLMASPINIGGDYRRIEKFLNAWNLTPVAASAMPVMPRPEIALPLREAVLARTHPLPVDQSLGCIASSIVCPCPPGVPIVMPGERIDENVVKILKIAGINSIKVVK